MVMHLSVEPVRRSKPTYPGTMEVYSHPASNIGAYIQAASPQPVAFAVNVSVH